MLIEPDSLISSSVLYIASPSAAAPPFSTLAPLQPVSAAAIVNVPRATAAALFKYFLNRILNLLNNFLLF